MPSAALQLRAHVEEPINGWTSFNLIICADPSRPCGLCANCKEPGVQEMPPELQMFEVDEETLGLVKLRKVRKTSRP